MISAARTRGPSLLTGLAAVLTVLSTACSSNGNAALKEGAAPPEHRAHLDHSAFFPDRFESGQDVTRACLSCHEGAAADLMNTAHWTWLGAEVEVPGHEGSTRIGKKNLINNFCISVSGNWASCTRCHAGYGWTDSQFDFEDSSRVDCLVCHDRSGQYRKGAGGVPESGVDLAAAARSVGFPRRDNCGVCHNYGGGGLGVKHGDLDSSLDSPTEGDDVHMGRQGMLCIDCHGGAGHDIKGRSLSVGVEDAGGIGCTGCHRERPHADDRLDSHTDAVACQTCHIPTYARRNPTKTNWDWSKAGDDSRSDNVHKYLKIKGEFVYGQNLVPEYRWFNGEGDRYLAGDRIAEQGPTVLNQPHGSMEDKEARIWPFKVHRGRQPADRKNRVLLQPVTAGEGGYWHNFDWDKAFRLGAELTGIPYSGQYEFVETEMYWPLSHMVAPADKALRCVDCHGPQGRMDWSALGYGADPAGTGGRER